MVASQCPAEMEKLDSQMNDLGLLESRETYRLNTGPCNTEISFWDLLLSPTVSAIIELFNAGKTNVDANIDVSILNSIAPSSSRGSDACRSKVFIFSAIS